INGYVNESLARRHQDDPTRWTGVLARRISVSNDGRVYTIELEPGIHWADPFPHTDVPDWLLQLDRQELTADDFRFAFDMLKDPLVVRAAPVRSWYSGCRRLDVVDRYTFTMTWDEPGLAAELWTFSFMPIPEHIFAYTQSGTRMSNPALELDNHWYRWPIGTGPYRL